MARTKLFSLLRKSFEKARLANSLGLTDKSEIEAAYRRHRAAQDRSRREVLAMFSSAAALGVVGAACGDDGGGTGGGSGGGSSSSTASTASQSSGGPSSTGQGGAGGEGGAGGQGGEGGAPPAQPEVVAVVGAGIAGLHCAMRLREAEIDVTVYDMQDRVGGRMFTGRGLFAEDQICELGGELIDSNHATLFALAEELEIELDDRLEDADGIALDTYFIDGEIVSDELILEQFQAVADVMADDAAAADEDEEAYAALDETSLDAYLQEKVPVADYPELHAILQIAYRGEFGLENDEQSALNMLYLIGSDDSSSFRIFGDSDERYHAHEGNDVFPTRMAEVIGEDRIRLEHKLVRIADGEDGGFELVFETADGDVTVQATRVVFALPFSVLRDVDTANLTLSDEKREIIDSLGYGTNAKVMGGFDTRFWLEEYQASGSLYTDGPIQQTWDTSIGQEGTTGILTNFLGGDRGLASDQGTPAAWWAGNLGELEQVWPGAAAAFSGEAVRMHWPTAEGFKGSYTCYRVGQWAFYGLEGEAEGKLHFCGEHTSLDFQGWMEGGAETGALVAGKILEELEIALSPRHIRSLGIKLHVPQSVYSGSGGLRLPDGRRMNAFQRRRAIGDVVRKAKAALDSRAVRDAAE